MKVYEQAGSVFWLAFAGLVTAESVRLGLGTVNNPGTGFVTFVSGVGLGLLALAHLVRVSIKPREDSGEADRPLSYLGKVLPSFLALVAYAYLLPVAGYGIATFVLMFVLFWLVQPKRYVLVAIAALLAAALSQIVFQFLLKSQFPVGPWGF